jgi:hypothetical protein
MLRLRADLNDDSEVDSVGLEDQRLQYLYQYNTILLGRPHKGHDQKASSRQTACRKNYFFVAFFLGDGVPDACCCVADADADGSSPDKPLQSPDMSCEIISVGFDCIAICFLMRSFSSGSIWSIIFGMRNCAGQKSAEVREGEDGTV